MVDLGLRDTSAAASTAKEKVKVFWDDGLIVTVVQTLILIHHKRSKAPMLHSGVRKVSLSFQSRDCHTTPVDFAFAPFLFWTKMKQPPNKRLNMRR